ncbi:MAG: PKD domain-containing protein [Fibrobacterota bacterium]
MNRAGLVLLVSAGLACSAVQNFHGSVRDSVRIPSSTLFTGPAGGVEVSSDRADCFVERRGDYFVFWARDTGVYTAYFKSRSAGALQIDTARVTVTDLLPSMTLANRYGSLDMGTPLDFGLAVEDDGDSVRIAVDFDGDGRTDTTARGPGRPVFRFNRPTQSGEKDRTFTTRITVTDNDGHTLSDTAGLFVTFYPPKARAGDNLIGCVNEPILFSAKKSSDNTGRLVRHYWDFNGDGKLDMAVPEPEIEWTYDKAGDYRVCLKVEDKDGNLSVTDTVYASIMSDKPQVSIDFCPGGRVNEPLMLIGRGRVSCGEIDRYSWDFENDGKWDFTSHDQGRTQMTYHKPGNYCARFWVMDTKRDTASAVIQITIKP